MPITLGTARQVAADVAHDASDAKADRVFMRWIRSALSNLHSAHDWKHFYATRRIVTDPPEAGTNAAATQDATSITRTSPNWPSKYVTQLWDVLVSGDETVAFQFSAVATTTATLATGQAWTAATVSGKDHTAVRYRYSLPDDFVRRVTRLEDLQAKREIGYVIPAVMDALRNNYPWLRSDQADVYTIRGPYVEIHPGPSAGRRPLQLSYMRQVTLPADADADATNLDWPAEYEEALWRAIELEAASWSGASRFPYDVAFARYQDALRRTVARDAKVGEDRGRSMTLSLPGERGIGRFYRNPTSTTHDQ